MAFGRSARVLRHTPPGDAGADLSGACLKLFPLAPGDLAGRNGTSEAAEMDVDRSDDDPTGAGLRLWHCTRTASMLAFKAMVQAVRAP